MNKPTLATFNGTSPLQAIEWVYDASGNKLKKVVKSGATVQYTQHYPSASLRAGNGIEYRQGPTGAPVIKAIYHPEGRVFYTSATASRYEYSIRDHLGNTRLTFSDLNNNNKVDITTNTATNEVLQENHYYPFGLSTNGAWMNAPALDNLYQYNGKELNADWGLNMLDYGARMYMADVGRWGGVDAMPVASVSSYTYVLNRPLALLDPTGMYAEGSSHSYTDADANVRRKMDEDDKRKRLQREINQTLAGGGGPIGLTTHRLRDIARSRDWGQGVEGVTLNRRAGRAFQNTALSALGLVPENGRRLFLLEDKGTQVDQVLYSRTISALSCRKIHAAISPRTATVCL